MPSHNKRPAPTDELEPMQVVSKTPKQLLLEFYALHPDAQKPTFQVLAVPGASTQDSVQFRATVVCPSVKLLSGTPAFEDILFEGEGKSKKAAEQQCADKAFTFIRSISSLKLPSAGLLQQVASPAQSLGAAAAPLQPVYLAVPPPATSGMAAVNAAVPLAAGALAPAAAAAAPPLGLTINEAMIESMPAEQLRIALKEVLGLYKNLVQGIHEESLRHAAEGQRHAAELQAIIMRQL